MTKVKGLSGQKMDKLLVLDECKTKKFDGELKIIWKCQCECGSEVWIRSDCLTSYDGVRKLDCGCRTANN